MRKLSLAIGLLALSMTACSGKSTPETTTQVETTMQVETTTQAPETTTQAETTTKAPETTTQAPETTTQAEVETTTVQAETTVEETETESTKKGTILGELTGLEGNTLSYIDTEWVDEDDNARIAELEKLGVELDFPNGYYIYQPDETKKTIELADNVKILFVDEEMGDTYTATLEQLKQRLTPNEDGEVFFGYADLKISNGKVVKITERWTV